MLVNKFEDLVSEMLKYGHSPEQIVWLVNSVVIKKCDVEYRLNRALDSSDRYPVDMPDGDSVPSTLTKKELDDQLDQYSSHGRNCKCYKSENDCPICLEFGGEQLLLCCKKYFHQKCLGQLWENGQKRCPLCRHDLALDIKEEPPRVIADTRYRRECNSCRKTFKTRDSNVVFYCSDCINIRQDPPPENRRRTLWCGGCGNPFRATEIFDRGLCLECRIIPERSPPNPDPVPGQRECTNCHGQFYPSQPWHTRCIPCNRAFVWRRNDRGRYP